MKCSECDREIGYFATTKTEKGDKPAVVRCWRTGSVAEVKPS